MSFRLLTLNPLKSSAAGKIWKTGKTSFLPLMETVTVSNRQIGLHSIDLALLEQDSGQMTQILIRNSHIVARLSNLTVNSDSNLIKIDAKLVL